MITAILAWWAVSKAISAAMRYRLAIQQHDPQEAVKQSDRLGSALGMLAFVGVLGGIGIAKARRERLNNALKQANLPAPT